MNDLSVYERMPDPLAAVREMGAAIAKSRLFGCESVEQGIIFAWECFARRVPPLSLTETYHVIDGKLSMRADAMLARFIEQGGRHEIIERSPERAAVQLWQDGSSQTFSFTWEEAQQEGLQKGKNGVKTNWSTPRRRMQMLWARVVSDAVRAMAPQVCAGRYTPEDFGQVEQDREQDGPQIVDTAGEVVAQPAAPEAVKEAAGTETPGKKPAGTEPSKAPPADAATTADGTDNPTAAVRQRIEQLYETLAVPLETREAALRKRGVSSLRSLTKQQAGEILAKLEAAANRAEIDREVAGKSSVPDAATVARMAGPCSQEQIERAKQLITEINQLQPGIVDKIKAKLVSAGMQKIADLSMQNCDSLLAQLGRKNVEAFFVAELTKPTVTSGN